MEIDSHMVFTQLRVFVDDEAAGPSNDSSLSMDCSTVLRVKTLHISSPILAAKSPYFYKVRALYLVMLPLFTCVPQILLFIY